MVRLFVGTFLEPHERNLIAALPEKHVFPESLTNRKIRWISPEKLHMTWVFIGEVQEESIKPIAEALTSSIKEYLKLAVSKMEVPSIKFDRIAIWPNKRNARHLVITASRQENAFRQLSHSIRKSMIPFCQGVQEEKFRPHITLFRISRKILTTSTPDLIAESGFDYNRFASEVMTIKSSIEPLVLRLNSVHLVASHLGSPVDAYQSLHSFSIRRED